MPAPAEALVSASLVSLESAASVKLTPASIIEFLPTEASLSLVSSLVVVALPIPISPLEPLSVWAEAFTFEVDVTLTLPPAVNRGPFTEAETFGDAVTLAALVAAPTIPPPSPCDDDVEMPLPTTGKRTLSGTPPGPSNCCVPATVDDGPRTITSSWLPDDEVIGMPCGPIWNTVFEPIPPSLRVIAVPFCAFWGDDANWNVPFWELILVT